MLKSSKGFTIIETIIAVVIVLFVIGYVANIVRFCKCDFKAPYKAEVIYGGGIFLGYGVVTGYIGIDD